MSNKSKLKQLVLDFEKVNKFDSSELEAGIELLKKNNWSPKIVALRIKLFIDHGNLLNKTDLEYIEELLDKELKSQSVLELTENEKIAKIIKVYEGGYPEIDIVQLKSIAVDIMSNNLSP